MLNNMLRRIARIAPLLALLVTSALYAEDFFFDSAGVKIHYTVEGKGEPVLLIHGYSASAAVNWALPGVTKGLASNYQVIAIDNRGHGQSDKPHDPAAYAGDSMAMDSIRLLDHLKIEKAHIVGYSMGGFLATWLVTEHPERVLSATIGGAGWYKPEQAEQMGGMLKMLAESLEQGKGLGPLIVALTPVGQPPMTPQQVEATNKMFLSMGNDQLALAAVARAGFPIVSQDKLRESKIPVLALIGEVDPLKAAADNLDGMIPDFKMVVIPGANHLTAFANPLFVTSLKGFLGDHSRTLEAAKQSAAR
jgi:pimeloyl-ACP methyl ester carboxylesterase